jgi:DNA-binding SARP family transcriptional activator
VYLFGGLKIQDARGLRPLSGERLVSLLAYLVLNPRVSHRREALAQVLSPESRPDRVRANLSNTLHRLRNSLGEDWLEIQTDRVALRVDPGLWVDVWEFDRLSAGDRETDLRQAVDLYTGDLLPELYEDWILPERELRRNQFLLALENLGSNFQSRGQLEPALLAFRRLILAEPLHEPAHLQYLRLLGRMKRFAEAFAHYEYLRHLLQEELGAEPMEETRLVAQAIENERALAAAHVLRQEKTEFVGRVLERASALEAVEAALQGSGGILAVEGEAGIGKSRFLREVAAGARWRGATVIQGLANQTPGISPFAPLTSALASVLDGPRLAQLEELLARETLSALTPVLPVSGTGEDLPEVTSAQAGRDFFNALDTLGETLAQLFTPVLILDDLQWADRTLWESLRALERGFSQGGALLLFAYRRPEIEATAGWEILQEWDQAGKMKVISLKPLELDEVAQMVTGRLEADPSEILAVTGGNPFFISQWLAEPPTEGSAPQNTISRRLEGLSPSSRAVLECAAVFGDHIPYRLWSEASGLDPLALAGLSDELAAKGWLDHTAGGYAFAHTLLRQAVYQEIAPGRRKEIHTRSAQVYEELEPGNFRALAFHLDQAGRKPEAARAYRAAGEQDLARFAFHEAQQALQRALVLQPVEPTLDRIETALALAAACAITGDYERQRPALEEGLAGARRLEDRALLIRALFLKGRAVSFQGSYKDAITSLNEALELSRQIQDRTIEAEAIYLQGVNALQHYRSKEAHEYFSQALERARAINDPSLEGRTLKGLGDATRDSGMPLQAMNWLEQALEIHLQQGDRRGEALTRTTLLAVFYDLGAWDRLLESAKKALQMVEDQGNRHAAAFVRHMQSLAALNLGNFAGARRSIQQAERDFDAVLNRQSAVMARLVLGLIAENESLYEEAERNYRTALDEAQASGWVFETAYARHDLGSLFLLLERPGEALPLLERAYETWSTRGENLLRAMSGAMLGLALLARSERTRAAELAQEGLAVFRESVPTGEQPQAWLWALYRLLNALDQEPAAGAVIRGGYEELQRQARAIGDPELRNRFFYHVPLNRAILAAYDTQAARRRFIEVSLARAEAPLGRTLEAGEHVSVTWTVDAPEDEAISGKTERRRHRLIRLLQEAERQGAAPTDDDLASALGVNRRTILRDMQALVDRMPAPATRKRKKKKRASPGEV